MWVGDDCSVPHACMHGAMGGWVNAGYVPSYVLLQTLENCDDKVEEADKVGGWAQPRHVPAFNLLSGDPAINPRFASFNRVFLPYCSMVCGGKPEACTVCN